MSVIYEPIPEEVEWVGRRVIGCAISVHRVLGPGYKESIYVEALCPSASSTKATGFQANGSICASEAG